MDLAGLEPARVALLVASHPHLPDVEHAAMH